MKASSTWNRYPSGRCQDQCEDMMAHLLGSVKDIRSICRLGPASATISLAPWQHCDMHLAFDFQQVWLTNFQCRAPHTHTHSHTRRHAHSARTPTQMFNEPNSECFPTRTERKTKKSETFNGDYACAAVAYGAHGQHDGQRTAGHARACRLWCVIGYS